MQGKELEHNKNVVKFIGSTKLINWNLKCCGVVNNLTWRSALGHEANVLKPADEKNLAVLFCDKFLGPRNFCFRVLAPPFFLCVALSSDAEQNKPKVKLPS